MFFIFPLFKPLIYHFIFQQSPSIDVYNMTMGFYFVVFIAYLSLSFIVIGILSVCLLKRKVESKTSSQCKNDPNREPQDREIDLQDGEAQGYIEPTARLNNFFCDPPPGQHTWVNQKGVYDDEWDDESLDYENASSLARRNINMMSNG